MSDTNDMRREFERHVQNSWLTVSGARSALETDSGGTYLRPSVVDCWSAWQAATERATPSQWQPIATAPKDESVIILGYLPHQRMDRLVYEGRWHSDQLTWTSVNGFLVHNSATHWMPLPPPPAIRKGGVTGTTRLYEQYDAEQEAKHCGGSTRAYPVYTKPFVSQPDIYPLETQAEFALKTLVTKGWVTQEKVDRVMQIAAKFTAHLPKEIS